MGIGDWREIASSTMRLIKTAFSKASGFLNGLFDDTPLGASESMLSLQSVYYNPKIEANKSLGQKLGEQLAKTIRGMPWTDIGKAVSKLAIHLFNDIRDFFSELNKKDESGKSAIEQMIVDFCEGVDWDGVERAFISAARETFIAIGQALGTIIIQALFGQLTAEEMEEAHQNTLAYAEDQADRMGVSLSTAYLRVGESVADSYYAGMKDRAENTDDVAPVFESALDFILNAADPEAKGKSEVEQFYSGFKNTVLDDKGEVKSQFESVLEEIFLPSELEALKSGTMTVDDFAQAFEEGTRTIGGDATQALTDFFDLVFNSQDTRTPAKGFGDDFADTLFSSIILQTLLRQPDAENAVDGAFNEIMSGIDANGYGDIIAFDYFNSFMKEVMDESGHVKPEFKDVVESMFGSVETLEDGKVDAKDFMRGLVQGMWDSSGDTSTKLVNIIDNVLEKVRTDPDALDEHSPSKRAAQYGEDFLKGFSVGVGDEEDSTTKSVKSTFSSITDIAFAMIAMNLVVKLGMTTIKNTFEKQLEKIETVIKVKFDAINSGIDASMKAIGTNVTQSMTQMATTIRTDVSTVSSIVSNGFVGIKNSIVNNTTQAMTSVSQQNWSSIGSNIISGIQQGLNNGWVWLQRTVSDLAWSLYQSAKNALGIHSPSRLFREGVGEMLGLGVAEGMKDSQPKIIDTVADVADAMATEMNNADIAANLSANGDGLVNSLDTVLTRFSDKVSDSFSGLVDKLEAITSSVTFRTPVLADGSVVPYSVSAGAAGGTEALTEALDASNDELISALIQMFNNETLAIVRAIEDNCGVDLHIGDKVIGDAAIREINRRTRATGTSPIMI